MSQFLKAFTLIAAGFAGSVPATAHAKRPTQEEVEKFVQVYKHFEKDNKLQSGDVTVFDKNGLYVARIVSKPESGLSNTFEFFDFINKQVCTSNFSMKDAFKNCHPVEQVHPSQQTMYNKGYKVWDANFREGGPLAHVGYASNVDITLRLENYPDKNEATPEAQKASPPKKPLSPRF